MENIDIKDLLHELGKKRSRITREMATLRREIRAASIRAAEAGWNNQRIAEEIGVTREIIRRYVGPAKAGHGEQEHS